MAHEIVKPSCSTNRYDYQQKKPLLDKVPVKQFLLKSTLFKFFSFGSDCNGNAHHSFSTATCDLKKKKDHEENQWYGVLMTQLFESGYNFLQSTIEGKRSNFSTEELAALKILNIFFAEKDIHEKNIQNALEKMKNTENKETILTMALAEHLFGKLSPGQEYLVDSRIKGKDNKFLERFNEKNKCACGCGKEINIGGTGIGHTDVWHGFIDIMMLSNCKPDSVASVCLALDDDGPSPAKKLKSSDETDEEEEVFNFAESISEVKVSLSSLNKVQDQVTAETVVFALAYQFANPLSKVFIPNILISPSHFYIVMYEPVNDVLVWSTEFPLISQSDSKLQGVSVIALWMVLHYKLFCKGVEEIFEDVNEVKAGFRNQIDKDHWKIYKNQLKLGVSSFGAAPRIDLVQSLREVDFVFPKLKLKKIRTF